MSEQTLQQRKESALARLMADRSTLNSQLRWWKKQAEMLSRTREEQRRRAERAEERIEELLTSVSELRALVDGNWDNYRLAEALQHIGTGCEHFTHGSCRGPTSGKTRDAEFWEDRWCDGCIAAEALEAGKR